MTKKPLDATAARQIPRLRSPLADAGVRTRGTVLAERDLRGSLRVEVGELQRNETRKQKRKASANQATLSVVILRKKNFYFLHAPYLLISFTLVFNGQEMNISVCCCFIDVK